MQDRSLANFLEEARQMLSALDGDADLAKAFEGYPLNAEWLAETQALYDEVVTAVSIQQREKAEQIAATEAFYNAQDTLKTAYMKALRVARVAFMEETQAQKQLQLNGTRAKAYSKWIQQVERFYSQLLSNVDWVATMASYKYPEAKLQEEASLIPPVRSAKDIQIREMGESQAATLARDEKIDALDKRIQWLRALAPIALEEDYPQWQEKLGIVERRD